MSSTSETGHAVNYANLTVLISRCTGYGTRYNPSNAQLTLVSLNTLHTNTGTTLGDINAAKPAWDNAINHRQAVFFNMDKLTTKVINAFEATENITQAQIDDARTVVRKIRGARKGKKILNPSPDDPQQISVSQQSFANQLAHFSELIGIVAAVPAYTPNETELQVAQLNTFLSSMSAATNAVNATQTPYLNALVARNNIMYGPNGLVDTALAVKKYVRSVSTITKEEFKQISGLTFTRLRKKPATP